MQQEYLDVLRHFGEGFIDGDFRRALGRHSFPFTLERMGRREVFKHPEACAADLGRMLAGYRSAGVCAISPRITSTRTDDAGGTFVDVEWALWTGAGRRFCTIFSTYRFVDGPDGPRLSACISKNEVLERPLPGAFV
ncbi:MAG: hypothetical protein AAGA32_18020 [Pseudomonadota bacterium]